MVEFNWSEAESFDLNDGVLNDWLNSVCVQEGFELGDVVVVFCSDEELLKTNRDFLNHDYYTDIITFDYCEDKLISGDLFVSIDRIKDNARALDVSESDELHRVIVHGVLHLCGYGDKGDEEELEMRKKEDFYLNKLKGFT